MPTAHQHSEAESKKPRVSESVQSLIDRKKTEKESSVSRSVSEKMAGTQEDVSEVLAGAEKPKERVSESTGERGEGKVGGGKAAAGGAVTDPGATAISLKDYDFPNETVMVSKIRSAIQAQIKTELKNAKKFQGRLDRGGAENFNRTIARIRHLKEVIFSLFTATLGFLKDLYSRYFTPDGKRR